MRRGTTAYRRAVSVALAAAFVLVWMVGAVGVIGAAGDPADLMYGGVLAVGIIGASSRGFGHVEWHARWSIRPRRITADGTTETIRRTVAEVSEIAGHR